MADSPPNSSDFIGRARRASISLINSTPQLGVWQATGTAIAQAPNLTELRHPELGGDSIEFNVHGHSSRRAVQDNNGELTLVLSKKPTFASVDQPERRIGKVPEERETDEIIPLADRRQRRQSLREKHHTEDKVKWTITVMNGLKAFWKFFLTPVGFCITIYCLNIVAWGAMLFFLLLDAAPAMDYPSANDDNSPRKIWLEIASQILNALFCVTGFGLAPWRFRDLYHLIRVVSVHDKVAMKKLSAQNRSWFRPPVWYTGDGTEGGSSSGGEKGSGAVSENAVPTFTGQKAPPTPLWKLSFNILMMVLNTALQAVLSYFMWGYNRFDRPSWATGTFIGLGCATGIFTGLMSWWEGRKVKKIEGPEIKIIDAV